MEFVGKYSLYICILCSIITVYMYYYIRRKKLEINFIQLISLPVLHTLAFLLGCKLLAYIERMISNPQSEYTIGFSFYGSIYLMPLFYILLGFIFKKEPKKFLDYGTPAILISSFWARMNCVISGCCIGKFIGSTGIRVPTRLIELLCYIFIFGLILYKDKKGKLKTGIAFPLYLIIYGIVRMIEEPFRDNFSTDVIHFGLIHSSIAIIIGIISYTLFMRKNSKENLKNN